MHLNAKQRQDFSQQSNSSRAHTLKRSATLLTCALEAMIANNALCRRWFPLSVSAPGAQRVKGWSCAEPLKTSKLNGYSPPPGNSQDVHFQSQHQMTDFGDERPRKRAKLACTNCNARRVKCDVTDRQPCRNCEIAQAVCETRESKRGKHPRKPKVENGKHNHAPLAEYVARQRDTIQSSSALTLVALSMPR